MPSILSSLAPRRALPPVTDALLRDAQKSCSGEVDIPFRGCAPCGGPTGQRPVAGAAGSQPPARAVGGRRGAQLQPQLPPACGTKAQGKPLTGTDRSLSSPAVVTVQRPPYDWRLQAPVGSAACNLHARCASITPRSHAALRSRRKGCDQSPDVHHPATIAQLHRGAAADVPGATALPIHNAMEQMAALRGFPGQPWPLPIAGHDARDSLDGGS